MHVRTLAVISAIPFMAAISVGSSAPQFPRSSVPQFLSSPSPQSSDTANLYRVNCQMCHGPLGKALIPEMAFVGRKWKHGTSTTAMAKIITEGVKGTPMMPFKKKLTPAQVTALARYVRAFDKTLPKEK